MYIHLRTHSSYSFLRGLPAPAELVQAAVRYTMPALALTDINSMSGAIEFYLACQEAGIQAILGEEFCLHPSAGFFKANSKIQPVSGSLGLVLLAMDPTGWSSLCHLSSLSFPDEGSLQGTAITIAQLVEHSTGLIFLAGGGNNYVARAFQSGQEKALTQSFNQLKTLFGDRLYVDLQWHSSEDSYTLAALAALASRLRLPRVATHNVFYLSPEEAGLQKILTAIRLNRPLDDLPENSHAPSNASFITPAEMAVRFAGFPDALEKTAEIAARCRLTLPLDKPQYPKIDLPAGQSPLEALRLKAQAGAQTLYGEITSDIQSRMDHELAVIGECGYASLFLVMEEIVQFTRRRGVPISSRGSAASSLVAHCLGITSPDPLRLNLYFERFLNPARATPPDIDTDLCSRRREEVIRHVYTQFGADRVAMICTINRFRRRSALREVAKAYRLPPAEIKSLVDRLPHRGWGPSGYTYQADAPFAELADQFPSPIYQTVFHDAAALLGHPHHLSVHPGGMVIAPGPINDLVPTQLANRDIIITQFDMDSIERLGLVKIDLLGIRGLTVIGDVAATIHASRQLPGASPVEVLEMISEQDLETSQAVQGGRTIGCFQIESPGMRATLKEIQARSVDDIMIALALYRPGPLTGGLKDAFVRRHLGQEPVSQLHPSLTPLLADTYGVILYQEQVLRIAHQLAGLSLADADLLRRAMSHFDPGKQMQTLKEKFIAGASAHNQVPEATAERIWELMAAFAGYGFPKAHAASYAQVAWRAAWCKTHYPEIFIAAVLANWGGFYSQRVYLTEARRMGISLRPPDINFARPEFSVNYIDNQPVLYMGLNQVRDLTKRTQEKILRSRPFHSLVDFLVRVDPRLGEVENLIRVGALDEFGLIPGLLRQLKNDTWRKGQLPLFALTEKTRDEEDWTLAEKVTAQEALLGVGVVAHRLELFSQQIETSGAITTVEAAAQIAKTVRVAGMRQTWQRNRTVRGEYVYWMGFEDLEGMLDVLLTAGVYHKHRSDLNGEGPFIIEGKLELNPSSAEPYIRAEKVSRLDY